MSSSKLLAAIATLFCLAFSTEAANSIQWTFGFPKTGDVVNTISCCGTYTHDAGWDIKPDGQNNRYVVVHAVDVMNNQNKKDFSILVDPANGQWGGTTGISCDLGAGNSGKTFACTPHAIFTNGTTDVDIGGQTVNAQAK